MASRTRNAGSVRAPFVYVNQLKNSGAESGEVPVWGSTEWAPGAGGGGGSAAEGFFWRSSVAGYNLASDAFEQVVDWDEAATWVVGEGPTIDVDNNIEFAVAGKYAVSVYAVFGADNAPVFTSLSLAITKIGAREWIFNNTVSSVTTATICENVIVDVEAGDSLKFEISQVNGDDEPASVDFEVTAVAIVPEGAAGGYSASTAADGDFQYLLNTFNGGAVGTAVGSTSTPTTTSDAIEVLAATLRQLTD